MFISSLKCYKSFRIIIVLFVLGGILCLASSSLAGGAIQEVKLKAEGLPQGWKLVKEYPIPQDQLKQFEAKFAAGLDEMLNQIFTVDNQKKVQVNYVTGHSESNVSIVYQALIGMVGAQNVIVKKGNVVIEIISDDPALKRTVVDLLELSELQRRKLTTATVPANWRLVKEFFVYGDQLKQFEKKFEADIQEMINQFFLVDKEQLRVNYVVYRTPEDAESAYKKLYAMVGEQNLVLKKDTIVLEIITADDRLKKEAEKIVDKL